MAKKKKKQASAPKPEPKFNANPFGELAGLQQKPVKPKKAEPAPAPAKTHRPGELPADLEGDALFDAAMASFDPNQIYDKKYGQQEEARYQQRRREHQRQAQLSPEEREADLFFQEMATSSIKRMGDGPKRVVKVPVIEAKLEVKKKTPIAPQIGELNGEQQKLLSKVRKAERRGDLVLTLTLRGLPLAVAEARLYAFLQRASAEQHRYVRVVSGKGKQSEEGPVLKPMAHEVLKAHDAVALFAPEINKDGNFGAFVVRLK